MNVKDINYAQDILQYILNNSYLEIFPNVLRIFVTFPITVTSAERSFSKVKLIKNYIRSPISAEKLSALAILSIEKDIVKDCDFCNIINDMAIKKSHI